MYEYQTSPDAGLGLIPILFLVGLYCYFAWCQMKMAQKLGLSDTAWWSWIPIMNTFLLFKMAGKPNWWFFLCLIPVINIVCFAILWMESAKKLNVPSFWGFLVLIPLINFVALGVMAFAAPPRQFTPPPSQPAPRQPEQVG